MLAANTYNTTDREASTGRRNFKEKGGGGGDLCRHACSSTCYIMTASTAGADRW